MMRYLLFFVVSIAFSQQNKHVDFTTCNATIGFNVAEKEVYGQVAYTFDVKDEADTIYIDARNMAFENVRVNGKKKTGWLATTNALKLYKGFKKGKNTVTFRYSTKPRQTLYFVKDGNDVQIWTQGQGKYTSYWLPSFDDMNEKVVFNLSVTYNKGYTVLANGTLKDTATKGSNTSWLYTMDKPMSSYLVMLAIGKYEKRTVTSVSGTPLEFYLRPEDTAKFEPTYRYSKQIFDFFEREIGVNYPWHIYRQIPVLDFLYAGMENTTSTIFSQDFVVDSIGFNDRTYINVNAHELAHQWFGDMITAQSGKHHWLQEGFATYYALLAEQELFGEDHFNYELYEIAERLQQASATDTIPILNEHASSLSFYQKGAWALHVLREGVGHEKFRDAVKNYLIKYNFKNVNTDEFLAEISKVAPDYDTAGFKQRWLESGTFQVQEAIDILSQNRFMQLYFKVGELADKRFEEKKPIFIQILQSDQFYPVKEEVLFQMAEVPFEDKAELIKYAMQSGDIKLRQAVARTTTVFPEIFYEDYKTFLYDNSYITREIALNVLYAKFPEKRSEILNISQNWLGFNDKNLRILWLTLAYKANNYKPDDKAAFYAELLKYAGPEYESSIRQNALSNLLYLNSPDEAVLKNLVNATTHHKWQFVKFGKDNIRKLLKKAGYRERFEALLPTLQEPDKTKLEVLLKE
ncbi:M1 family metallopeptidase [Flavobacterium rhizosphaerae]|uniref:Aminopeptidase N n=1 Tax=Flavobacterium rhizosphaerae TaxID=3163298 RepID=A0ABW8YUV7_9FLAO